MDGWVDEDVIPLEGQINRWVDGSQMDKWSPSSLGMPNCLTFASFPLPSSSHSFLSFKINSRVILSVLLNKSQISNWLVRVSSILIVKHASEWLRSWGELEKSPRCWEKMRNMTFRKGNQFSLTKTVASVNHIIHPINSHNAKSLTKERGERRGRKRKKG